MKDAYDLPHRLYFAYGSNLNPGQMAARCSKPKVLTVARLANHQIAFHGHSKKWDGGEETAIPQPGEDLWGVVYQLSFSDAEYLDSWQDVRLDGTGPYFHYPTVVTDEQGNRYPVLLYKKDLLSDPQMPSEEYLNFIVAGAKAHGLPRDYLARLQTIATRKASYAVPKQSRFDRSILFDRCSGCGEEAIPPKTGPASIPVPALSCP